MGIKLDCGINSVWLLVTCYKQSNHGCQSQSGSRTIRFLLVGVLTTASRPEYDVSLRVAAHGSGSFINFKFIDDKQKIKINFSNLEI